MKKENIHDLIERGSAQQKEQSWERIEGDLCIGGAEQPCGGGALAIVRSKKFIVCACLAVCVAAILLAVLLRQGGEDDFRFYSQDDYAITATDVTIKEYAQQNGLDILYFDWYEQPAYYSDAVYTLNGSDEVICYSERILDIAAGNFISLYVTQGNTQLDFLDFFTSLCPEEYAGSGGVEIMWGGGIDGAYAWFECGGYKYYLRIYGTEGSAEVVLDYAELLLLLHGETDEDT